VKFALLPDSVRPRRGTLAALLPAWLLALLVIGAAGPAEARFEGIARAGDWTVYRDNTARPFDNYATPLVIGTFDRSGAGALALQCRPDTPVFAPTQYSVSGAFLFLNFAPDTRGLVSTPWRTPVVLEVGGAEYHTPYVLRLPFVSGFLLEKLAADADALYDDAQTVLLVPPWTIQSMERQMRDGGIFYARLYDREGRRVELAFSLDGYATARDALETACNQLNKRRPS
jgi:hypothetical protein